MKLTRRQLIKGFVSAGMYVCGSSLFGVKHAFSNNGESRVFKIEGCPVHDGHLRHEGLDGLFDLLAANGIHLYLTGASPLGAVQMV